MKAIKIDFSTRDERDRIPIPPGEAVEKNEKVLLYDNDIQVFAFLSIYPGKLDIDWSSMRVSGWKSEPPEDVKAEVAEFPRSSWKHWPED